MSLWLAAAAPAAADGDVAQDIEIGEAAWQEGRWLDASKAFARVYERTQDARYLYARAQAERLGGRCEVAMPLYEQFLDTDPNESNRQAAEGFLQMCRDEQVKAGTDPEQPVEATTEPSEPNELSELVGPSDPEIGDGSSDGADPPRPWYRDPIGGTLVGVGLAASGAGAALVGLGFRGANQADSASDDRAFGQQLDRARSLTTVGSITLGIGGTLLLSGIVRWAVVARRTRGKRSAVLQRLAPIVVLDVPPGHR